MSDRAILPPGLTPRFLTTEQAAAYVGVSRNLFMQEVQQGWWPRPLLRGARDSKPTWDRRLLDLAADRRAGIVDATGAESSAHSATDVASAEQAALEACDRATPPHHRHKVRGSQRA